MTRVRTFIVVGFVLAACVPGSIFAEEAVAAAAPGRGPGTPPLPGASKYKDISAAYADMVKHFAPTCGPQAEVVNLVAKSCPGAEHKDCAEILAPSQNVEPTVLQLEGASVSAGDEKYKTAIDTATNLLDSTATSLGLPQLGGVVDDLTQGHKLLFLQGIGDLEEPQSLGYMYTSDKIAFFKFRIGGFATPEPTINPLLKQQLIADNTLSSFSGQEGKLDVGDDYYYQVEASLFNSWFGRDVFLHTAESLGVMQSALTSGGLADKINMARQIEAAYRDDTADHSDDRAAMYAVGCAAIAQEDAWQQLNARLAVSKLGGFDQFAHNQPQFTVRFRRLYRDDIVGADSKNVRATFSTGIWNNLNWLKLLPSCSSTLEGPNCHAAYTDMANSWPMRSGLGFSSYFEAGTLSDVTIEMPPPLVSSTDDQNGGGIIPGVPLPGTGGSSSSSPYSYRIDGGSYQRYGGTLGFTLLYPKESEEKSKRSSWRLDAGGDHFDYRGQGVRVNHDVWRVTLTYKRGTFSFPLHVMYRSKTEFDVEGLDSLGFGLGLGVPF